MEIPWGFYIGWDWHWIVLAVMVGVSYQLAKKPPSKLAFVAPVLWLLPALFLYSGVDWLMPPDLMRLFRWAFWLSFVATLVTWLMPLKTFKPKLPLILIGGLLAAIFFVGFVNYAGNQMGFDLEDISEPFQGTPDDEDLCDYVDDEVNTLVQQTRAELRDQRLVELGGGYCEELRPSS